MNLLEKAGLRATFNSAFKAAKTNPTDVQTGIARDVFELLNRINSEASALPQAGQVSYLRNELQRVVNRRQLLNAAGNNNEANPSYARAALAESAILALCSGDGSFANELIGDLAAWFSALGVR
jgi:hypothetical protein